MNDHEAIDHINELAAEEHELRAKEPGGGLDEIGQARLRDVEVQLDRCWDLLRQRNARRAAGEDPDEAHLRPTEIVEGYQQ